MQQSFMEYPVEKMLKKGVGQLWVKHLKCFITLCGIYLGILVIRRGRIIIMVVSLSILFGIFVIK